ncbi:uncharacterized protein LOC141826027 isoform X2 [Curcuma longa]|uniref:uncharacterized protein LOC141826027 isoform X2 n=1 Tax=Curcuma longa TaxID=136217 RepID=UPI003D9ED049
MSAKNSKEKDAAPGERIHESKTKTKKKKIGNEIDEIFHGKKKKSAPVDDQEAKHGGNKLDKEVGESGSSKMKDKKKRRKGALNEDSNTPSRRRRTSDGLTIYSADELGVGKTDAGGYISHGPFGVYSETKSFCSDLINVHLGNTLRME